MNSKLKYLLGNVGLFTIATFLPKALVFLMVPLYTYYLTTDEYGTADLLTNTVTLLMPILTLQVQDAVMRYAIRDRYDKKEVLSIGVKITCTGGIILVIACAFLSSLNVFELKISYFIFLCVNYFACSLNNIFSYFCRGIDKVKIITIGSILNTVLAIGCNLLFIIVLKWGVIGYLLATSIGALVRVVYIYLGANLKQYISLKKNDKFLTKDMIKFSVPMIFSALSWGVNNASAKYILNFFSGVSVVGVYAVSSKIPSILSAFGEVISKSFSISAIKEYDPLDSDGFLGKCYSMISFCMVYICAIIMALNIPIARILFSNDFFVAWKYCPPLLISVLFNQLSLSCENILLGIGNTNIISRTAIIGAAVNTLMNVVLINFIGAYGAAISTILGFLFVWLLRYIELKKHIKLRHDFKKELISYFLIFIQMILAYYGNRFLILELVIIAIISGLYVNYLIKITQMMTAYMKKIIKK